MNRKALQEQHERASGDAFIAWLNEVYGTKYEHFGRPGIAPDLEYRHDATRLYLEITTAYYEGAHGKFLWDAAIDNPDEITGWCGHEPDASLVREISSRIAEKSKKNYGGECALIVVVPPSNTSAETLVQEFATRRADLETPFIGIYLAGRFKMTESFVGGYAVIPIKKLSGPVHR